MAQVRKGVMSLMRKAITAGQSRTAFIKDMRAAKTMYLGRQMLSDWMFLKQEYQRTGALTRLRRDVRPGKASIIACDWRLSNEYQYVVKVQTRLSPEAPLGERFVRIVTDERMTSEMMEQHVIDHWRFFRSPKEEVLETATPWSVYKRVGQ